jgi:hypothetical protein
LVRALFLTLIIVVGSVAIGTAGFRQFAGFPWDYAFLHTCLILGDHDVHREVESLSGRIFAGAFLLYGRLVFFSLMTILAAPVAHRMFHRLHLDADEEADEGPGNPRT